MALSIGFGNSISLLPAIQATRLLTFASVGLPPTEHTCFFLVALPYGGFSPVRLQGRFFRQRLPVRHSPRVSTPGVSFAKSLCPVLKGYLPVWRTLFGLGLQADSSTGERCSQKT